MRRIRSKKAGLTPSALATKPPKPAPNFDAGFGNIPYLGQRGINVSYRFTFEADYSVQTRIYRIGVVVSIYLGNDDVHHRCRATTNVDAYMAQLSNSPSQGILYDAMVEMARSLMHQLQQIVYAPVFYRSFCDWMAAQGALLGHETSHNLTNQVYERLIAEFIDGKRIRQTDGP